MMIIAVYLKYFEENQLKMKNLIKAVIFCLCLFIGSAYSQKTKKTALKFSSAYSNLGKDCKIIEGSEGTDGASDCRGVGGYRIHVGSAAAALYIMAEPPDKKGLIPLATQNFDFDERKATIEWRMANGKPFAVIMRVAVYGEIIEENAYFGKKIGEELIVRGLRGFEDINFEVDAKIPNANQKAREMADNGYKQK